MSLSELKKQLKELRPKFGNTEDDLKKELDYHLRAKKSLEAKERMMKVREAKKSTKVDSQAVVPGVPAPAPAPTPKAPKAPKAPKEKKEVAPEAVSAKKAALLAQLAALGSA